MHRSFFLAGAYFAAFALLYGSVILFFDPVTGLSPWFLPPALTFFLLLACGPRYAILVPLATVLRFAFHPIYPGEQAINAFSFGLIIAVVYGTAAWILRRFFALDVASRRLTDIAVLIPLGGAIAAFIAAFPATLFLVRLGKFPLDEYWTQFLRFWLGDTTGIVTLTPLLVIFLGPRVVAYVRGVDVVAHSDEVSESMPRGRRNALEIAAMAFAALAVSAVAFGFIPNANPEGPHYFYLSLIPLVWIAVRYGLPGALIATFAMDTVALMITGRIHHTTESISQLQQFMLVHSATGLSLGAFVSAHARSNNQLRALVEEQQKAQAHVQYLAYHDELTGLANRSMLDLQLNHAIERARRGDHAIAALYLDLNDFKLINDTLGHRAGDSALAQLADRLRNAARAVDFVCRMSGDEFAMILPDLRLGYPGDPGPLDSAKEVAERVHAALRKPFLIDGMECFVTASIGVSVFPGDAMDASALIGHADAAMYRAKQLGHGYTKYYGDNVTAPTSRLTMNARMHHAVDRNEFFVVYQPVFDIRTAWRNRQATGFALPEYLDGAEALLRWRTPDGDVVGPAEFLPVLESTGLIERVGVHVMREACIAAAAAEKEFGALYMGANLSLRQISSSDSITHLLEAIDESGFDPLHLVLEITEATVMHDPALTAHALAAFARRGSRVAIDDFGTGSSSFTRLHEMPVTTLKIDQTFVKHVPQDKKACNIVGAMIDLAASLRMTLVAEGIEREDQWEFLVERGCRFGQGFLLSRPVELAELRALLAQRRRVAPA